MKQLTLVIVAFFALVVGTSAFAQRLDVQSQAEDFSLVLEEMPTAGRYWSLELIRARLVLELGVKIPVIANFSVNPEVEFHFVKK